MVNNRIKAFWLLLLMLMYTANLVMSIGQSYAYYENTVTASTLVEAGSVGMTSDCMVKKEEPAITVLAGELPLEEATEESLTVSFWLKSCGSDTTGKLAWSVSDPEHTKYLQITMKSGVYPIDPEMQVDLLKDVPLDISMTLTPTALARTTVHEMLKINVLITWGDEMWGTFQVILPEVKEKEENPDGGEDPELTGDEENNVPTNEHTGAEEPEDDIQTTWQEIAMGMLEGRDIQNEDSQDNVGPPDSTESTEWEIPEVESQEDSPIRLETLSRFDPSQKLPVKITLTEDITSIRLGLLAIEEEETSFEPFPDYTLFSLDPDKGYYMVYEGQIVQLNTSDSTTALSLLLDFSRTEQTTDEPLHLAMETYTGEKRVGTYKVEVTPDAQESCLTLAHPLDPQTQDVVFTAGDTREAAASAQSFGWTSRTLSKDNALEFTLPMEWLDAEMEYSVEMLTMTEDQSLEYIPVTLSDTGLYGKYTDYDLTHNLVFQVGENLPQAGTYRLNMEWNYEGICFAQTQTTFFINYSAHSAYTLGS